MNAYSTLRTNIPQATYHAPRLHVPCTTIHHYPTCTNNCHHMQIKLREAYFACVFLVYNIIGVSRQPWPPHSVLVALYTRTCTCQPLTVSHICIPQSVSHSHEMSLELLEQIKQLLLSQHRGQTSKSLIYI